MNTDPFFHYARERYRILLRRQDGEPKPWTEDVVLRHYRFCNVFREDDRTTIWFRKRAREQYGHHPKILEATVIFRWFNRIETGELLMAENLMFNWRPKRALEWLADLKPLVTAAYMVKTPAGKTKLEGLVECIEAFRSMEPERYAIQLLNRKEPPSLREVWGWLLRAPYLGPFMAYEAVTDLRHTSLLQAAPDVCSWANPGPGCARGLSRLAHDDPMALNRNSMSDRNHMVALMGSLLRQSRDPNNWPAEWPSWEMREVEHTLCEYDKYVRAQEGGRPKQRYDG